MTHQSQQSYRLSAASVVTAAQKSVAAQAGDDLLVLNLSSGQYYRLAGTAAHIWGLMRDPIRVSELRTALALTYEVPADTCERDILDFVQQLMDRGLAEVCLDVHND